VFDPIKKIRKAREFVALQLLFLILRPFAAFDVAAFSCLCKTLNKKYENSHTPGNEQVEEVDKVYDVSRRRFFQLAGGIAGAGVLLAACRRTPPSIFM